MSQSVVNFLFDAHSKLTIDPNTEGRVVYIDGQIVLVPTDPERSAIICKRIEKSIELLEANKGAVTAVSDVGRVGVLAEIDVPPELRDACTLAHRNKSIVLTDDYLYLFAESVVAEQEVPAYCSSFVLIKVLHQKGLISFDDYSNYFSYLASYYCRFLPLDSNDLMKATLGEGKVKLIQPENLRGFHLHITLSEKYGVSLQNALDVLCRFLANIIADDSVSIEATNRIFAEVLPPFLEGRMSDKLEAAVLVAAVCKKHIEIWKSQTSVKVSQKYIEAKMSNLESQLVLFYTGANIVVPLQ